MKIYVASSWRNEFYQVIIKKLREIFGEDAVYDWRDSNHAFHWSTIDPNWQNWTSQAYIVALDSPVAQAGFKSDFDAMNAADICVLLLPCGRSAHLESGWMKGAGKRLIIYTRDGEEPELMAAMADAVVDDFFDLVTAIRKL